MSEETVDTASPFEGEKAPPSKRADLITSAVLMVLGLTVVGLAWRMPTFVEQSGTGLTAPGIVPGFYGVAIAILAMLLALRTLRRPETPGVGDPGNDNGRLALAAALALVYAGGLVGRLPFWLATSIFVFAFVAAFEWSRGPAGRPRRLIEALAIGLGAGWAVTLLFEDLFLVRLP
ncbi:tripartite tricarboxylate transporter TctB family protein [Muricoccus radiodurans]|uniref:tripartite tricarboxylate transporter TctB family protein n=1 Tax=Muricoccus radiodurans TaxID=2231721 RepID=UPI003CEF5682